MCVDIHRERESEINICINNYVYIYIYMMHVYIYIHVYKYVMNIICAGGSTPLVPGVDQSVHIYTYRFK